MNKKNTLWTLFSSTFYISAFTFGGGYVIIPLMKKRFVDELGWIEENEMFDMIIIAQSSPGAVAVNASILVGRKIAGLSGALTAIIATILPPLLILSTISIFYQAFKSNVYIAALLRGMQAGIAAVIINVVIDMAKKVTHIKSSLYIWMMIGAFVAVYFLKINLIYIIITCAIIGAVQTKLTDARNEE